MPIIAKIKVIIRTGFHSLMVFLGKCYLKFYLKLALALNISLFIDCYETRKYRIELAGKFRLFN